MQLGPASDNMRKSTRIQHEHSLVTKKKVTVPNITDVEVRKRCFLFLKYFKMLISYLIYSFTFSAFSCLVFHDSSICLWFISPLLVYCIPLLNFSLFYIFAMFMLYFYLNKFNQSTGPLHKEHPNLGLVLEIFSSYSKLKASPKLGQVKPSSYFLQMRYVC